MADDYKITVIVRGKRLAKDTFANIISNLEYDNVKAYVQMQRVPVTSLRPVPPKKKK